MGRYRLLPTESQCIDSIKGISYNKGKISFVRRLMFSCAVLISLALLYLPTYHYAQRSFIRSGETESQIEGTQSSIRLVSSIVELEGWRYSTSRDLSTYILPQNTTTIINPNNICSYSPFLLIIICSAVNNFEARTAIRSTWGDKYKLDVLYNSTVKIAFLVGQSDNETVNNLITKESEQYGDVIQEQFRDTYNNLTLKSCMLLKWVTTNCGGLKYLMKTDDDMFVNISTFMKTLKTLTENTGVLLGSLICNAKPISDPKNKWYMPKYMYSNRTYPNYLSGTGYVMSFDVATKLYATALTIPLLHLEDVFITGLCAKISKIRPVNHPGFSYIPRKMDICTLKSIITAHKVNVPTMYTIWNTLQKSQVIKCSDFTLTKKMIKPKSKTWHFLFKKKPFSRCN